MVSPQYSERFTYKPTQQANNTVMKIQELHLSSVAGNKYGTVKITFSRKTIPTYYCGKLLWCENYPYSISYLS